MTTQTAKLTASAIVDAAIDVAARDGLDALSMRRIADELGVGAMSLYRHVSDKDALLQAMVVEIGRRYPYPVRDGVSRTWRERVAVAVDIDWELYQHHPWVVLAYSVPRYGLGADCLEGLEWLAEGFTELGVDGARAVEMVLTLWNFINGVALITVSEQLLRAEASPDVTGGVADLLDGGEDAASDPRLAQLPILAALARRGGVAQLADPRAGLDAGVAYPCAGFEASAGATTTET